MKTCSLRSPRGSGLRTTALTASTSLSARQARSTLPPADPLEPNNRIRIGRGWGGLGWGVGAGDWGLVLGLGGWKVGGRMSAMRKRLVILLILLSSSVMFAQRPGDWTQWRGPNRDGTAPAFTVPKAWPEKLTQRWKLEVGLGYSTPLIVGDRIYAFTRQGDDEVVAALEAATGKQIWSTKYPAPYTVIKAAMTHGPGPKSTPVFADGKIFTFGISGILSAFDAGTGKQLWQ